MVRLQKKLGLAKKWLPNHSLFSLAWSGMKFSSEMNSFWPPCKHISLIWLVFWGFFWYITQRADASGICHGKSLCSYWCWYKLSVKLLNASLSWHKQGQEVHQRIRLLVWGSGIGLSCQGSAFTLPAMLALSWMIEGIWNPFCCSQTSLAHRRWFSVLKVLSARILQTYVSSSGTLGTSHSAAVRTAFLVYCIWSPTTL